jgi:hypothetical protein
MSDLHSAVKTANARYTGPRHQRIEFKATEVKDEKLTGIIISVTTPHHHSLRGVSG